MRGEGKGRRSWTWGDWVLLALPFAAIPVVADIVGTMPPDERGTAWTLFLAAAGAAFAIGGAFVYRFLKDEERPDAEKQERNRRRNTALAVAFALGGFVFARRGGESARLVAMGLAFGGVVVTMLGYAVHVVRRPGRTQKREVDAA